MVSPTWNIEARFDARLEREVRVIADGRSRFADAIYVTVQSSRKAPFTKVVRRASGQIEEENYARTDHHDTRTKAKNVELFGVEGR